MLLRMHQPNETLGALVVTGGSRGIGSAIANLAAERGFAVAVNFANSEAAAHNVVDRILASGGRASPLRATSLAKKMLCGFST